MNTLRMAAIAAMAAALMLVGCSGERREHMLHIQSFTVGTNGYCILDVSTNGIVGAPIIETSLDHRDPKWIVCPDQMWTDHTNFLRCVVPSAGPIQYFRAISPEGGLN